MTNKAKAAPKTKPPAPVQTNTLVKFWEGLSDSRNERAHIMSRICLDAGITYQHLRGVMNRKRSLSIDAAEVLQEEIAKLGGKVELKDLLISSKSRL